MTTWKLMLLLTMVLTRTRTEQDSSLPEVQLAAYGTQRANRRRKTNSGTTTNTEQPADSLADQNVEKHAQHVEELTEPSVVEVVAPPKRRGPSLNKKTTLNLPKGSKINLTMDKDTKRFVGTTATHFSTECGIIIRSCCPMDFHKWDLLPDEVQKTMYEKLEEKFTLLRKDVVFMEYVNNQLHTQWKRTRGILSAHWKKNGGSADPRKARSMMKSDCKSEEDWNHLCDYWEMEKTQKYSQQMEINRGKLLNPSRGGSRSIANHVFQLTNPETQMPPSPLEMYYRLHYKADKQGWLNDQSRIDYENIVKKKETDMARLKSEGTICTTAIEHEIEKQAIKSVCGKEKTLKSAWEFGVGPVLKKKDKLMKMVAESSKDNSTEDDEDVRKKLQVLENENSLLKKFLKSKYPDFDITNPHVGSSSAGSEGVDRDSGEDEMDDENST
ncbi:hypothetical protein SSX86_024758 [Deinandra increscens subsp. villosa]|uniref:Transposase, Ptta/En/Spm, plant n=1 Tax=Deinandra increscens subsp. villosa TaxID=3103831 RepID=A0AAP0GML0_9ASTR